MEQILNEYYEDNAKKLRRKVDKILKNFGGLSDKDYDDFYSLANEVFFNVMKRYDGIHIFDAFLDSCLRRKIMTEITRRNREKRQADRNAVSIDTPISEDEETTLGDIIASNINIEKEIFEDEEIRDDKVEKYLASLSKIQRTIIEMKMSNIEVQDIKETLGLTDKQYSDCMKQAITYEHIKILDLEI